MIKTRSVCRYPEGQQWDKEMLRKMRGTPRRPVPGVESDYVPATLGRARAEDEHNGETPVDPEAEDVPVEVPVEREVTVQAEDAPVRRMYVSKTLVKKYGPTNGCPGCRDTGSRSVTHSEDCRQRMKELMAKDEEGKEHLKREDERQERHFPAEIEKQASQDPKVAEEQRQHRDAMEGVERISEPNASTAQASSSSTMPSPASTVV